MALLKASLLVPPGAEDDRRTADLSTLIASLAGPEPAERRGAARALSCHPEAAMALCDRLEIETSPSVRAVLLTGLIRLESPEVVARLLVHLRSEDAALRNATIEALQEMHGTLTSHLRTLLDDPDSDVRIFAVNILGALRDPEAPGLLSAVLRGEPHVNVCAAAVDALAEIGSPEAIDGLEEVGRRFAGEPFMTFAVETAIRRIRGG